MSVFRLYSTVFPQDLKSLSNLEKPILADFGSEGCRFKSCPVHHGFYWGFATLSKAGTTGTDRSELSPYLGYLLGAIGNAFRLQPPMVHPL